MSQNLPKISSAYKRKLSTAVLSVILFFIFYLFLIAVAVLLIIFLGYLAVQILSFKINYATGAFAVALFGIGIAVFYYLVKFIFVKNNYDNSASVQVNQKNQPELFKLIDEMVKKTATKPPKKVFISSEVNASVSYNSIFLSMFFPIRKNLTIGLGLINSSTIGELKTILAHEFGHFSQRSMKVGGYVNQAEKIIYDTVYNNKGYENALTSNNTGHFALQLSGIMAMGAIKVMQYFLNFFSEFLFKNHASLRREMEYNADAISTFVTNPHEQISSLLRINLSDAALGNAIYFYVNGEGKYQTKNVFENQSSLIQIFAERNNHAIENGLPKVDLEDIVRYNKSKIMIEDAYSSHPDLVNRIKRMQKNETNNSEMNNASAKSLIQNYEAICEAVTKKIMFVNNVKNVGEFIKNEEFVNFYLEKNPYTGFDKVYNGYYDDHNPILENLDELKSRKIEGGVNSLFNDEKTALVYSKNGIENDISILNDLSQIKKGIKTFQYDGNLYKIKNAKSLIPAEEKNLERVKQELLRNDENIFSYFYQRANESDKKILFSMYENIRQADGEYEKYQVNLNEFAHYIQFMTYSLPLEQIRQHRHKLLEKESSFKDNLREFVIKSAFSNYISEKNKIIFLNYLEANFVYFENQGYKNEETQVLFDVWTEFQNTLSSSYMEIKKSLLNKQIDIENYQEK